MVQAVNTVNQKRLIGIGWILCHSVMGAGIGVFLEPTLNSTDGAGFAGIVAFGVDWLLTAILLGIIQGITARKLLPSARKWVSLTILAWICSLFILGLPLVRQLLWVQLFPVFFLQEIFHSDPSFATFHILNISILGVVQGLFLRERKIPFPERWFMASWIGGFLGGLLTLPLSALGISLIIQNGLGWLCYGFVTWQFFLRKLPVKA
jgi:hypothetical protein